MKQTLVEADFVRAAIALDCEAAAIKAVCHVEAPRGGFNPDDTVATLFEGHKFYKYTKGAYATEAPDLCYPTWTRIHYGKSWSAERARLLRAMQYDMYAAFMSTSWGKFQIMGFNHAMCGFDNVTDFVASMETGEPEQLDAFVKYVRSAGLLPALRRHDWAGFALGYNGPSYAANNYDAKLADAYAKGLS